jgi:predicted peptidase
LKLRTHLIIAAVVIELIGVYAYMNHRQAVYALIGAGTKTRNGIVYASPRTEEPMGYHTQFFEKKQLEVDGLHQNLMMTYYWMEPDKPYPSGQKFPLVMVLHGAPGNAYAAQYLKVPDMKRDFPAFIFVPMAALSQVWAVPDKIGGVAAPPMYADNQVLPVAVEIIRRLMQKYPIDPARIYVMGCSDGAAGAYAAALRYPDIFAAAMPMSGGRNIVDAPQMIHVPMWIFHGEHDTIYSVSIARAMADSIKAHGGNVQYTEFPDMGHNCPSPRLYGRETWEWLFSQRKSGDHAER